MEMGKVLKALRMEKGVRQEDVADYLGVSCQAVSKWETCASLPDIVLLPPLAAYFGVSIDELFQIPREKELERIENMLLRKRRLEPETFRKAASFLQDTLTEDPKCARACSDLASLYLHRSRSDRQQAAEYAKRAMQLAPEEKAGKEAYLEAAGGICGDDWYDNHFEVIEYFREFLRTNPGNFHGLYAIIENLLADGRYEEALPHIRELKEIRDNYQPLFYLGDVEMGLGNRQKALAFWNEAVEKSPDAWQAYCSRADRIKKLGMKKEAMADYERCFSMQESPRIVDGLCSMAQMLEREADYAGAISCCQKILQTLRDDYRAEDTAFYLEYEEKIKQLASRRRECTP